MLLGRPLTRAVLALGILLASASATADTVAADDSAGPWQWRHSGFLTLAVGKVLGGSRDVDTDAGFRCPCLPTDYAQTGIYEAGSMSLKPDSVLGLQGSLSLGNGDLAATGQVVSRGARGGRANLEWLYGTWDINPQWTLQVGRKRLPLLGQSEVQDIGYAVPWVHLPPQVYGWEIVNYNGANLLFRGRWGEASVQANVFGGGETVEKSGLWSLYLGRAAQVDSRWSGIAGAELKWAVAGIEVRGVAITSKMQNRFVSDGETDFAPPLRQRIWGLSGAYDEADWVGRAEWLWVDRRQDYGSDRSLLVALGRRMGPWMTMVSWSRYQQTLLDPDSPAEGHAMLSLVLRRELDAGSALKLQLDRWQDRSGVGFAYPHGDRRLVSAAYVRVF